MKWSSYPTESNLEPTFERDTTRSILALAKHHANAPSACTTFGFDGAGNKHCCSAVEAAAWASHSCSTERIVWRDTVNYSINVGS